MALEIKKLENVQLFYVSVQTPKNKYKSEEKEYSVQARITQEQAKLWKKSYKKQPVKEYDQEDFQKAFKTELPEDVDTAYVVTLKREATYKDGNPIKEDDRPKVFVKKNGKVTDVTKTTLVGNGSYGTVSYFERISDEYGVNAKLRNVLVTDLVPYEKIASGEEFGEVDDSQGEFEDSSKPAEKADSKPKESKESSTKTDAKKPKKPSVSDDTEDPFA